MTSCTLRTRTFRTRVIFQQAALPVATHMHHFVVNVIFSEIRTGGIDSITGSVHFSFLQDRNPRTTEITTNEYVPLRYFHMVAVSAVVVAHVDLWEVKLSVGYDCVLTILMF